MSEKAKKPIFKKWWFWLICVIIVFGIIGAVSGEGDKKSTSEVPGTESQTVSSEEEIEPNTSAMVDSLYYKAKDDFNNVTEASLLEALNYIKDNYEDAFRDNETMENLLYYGFYLDRIHYSVENEDGLGNLAILADIGSNTTEYVKYVYRGAENETDEATITNFEQIQEDLAEIKGQEEKYIEYFMEYFESAD